MPPTADDFSNALNSLLQQAQQAGQSHLVVNFGNLHRQVGSYPGQNHRMPICCRVMRDARTEDDVILEAPPQGDGASLTIKYLLPRP
ncbi:hypothetical protein [Spirosoma sp.]|uniref:hypothetical protein n=1 Tax=Spirosoma sp. TaxID=1899569 RepID=UPI003B3AD3AF